MQKVEPQKPAEEDFRSSDFDWRALRPDLGAVVYSNLRLVAVLVSGALLLWAYSYAQLSTELAVPLLSVDLAVVFALVLFSIFFERLDFARRYPLLSGALLVMLLQFQRLFGIALTLDERQTTSLIVILIGAGYLLLSTPWVIAITAGSILAWCGLALHAGLLSEWSLSGLELFSAAVLTLLIHSARMRAYLHQARLQQQSDRRNTELERRALQLETLITAGKNINAFLDLDVLLQHVVDLVLERFGYYYVGIFQLDQSGSYMISRAGTGEAGKMLAERGFRLRISKDGLIAWVSRHRQSVFVNDVSKDRRYISLDIIPDTQSEMVLPLDVGGEFWGVLDIQCDQRGAFRGDDVRVFQSLADQVAIAIQNAVNYQAERSRRLLTETLYDVGRALSGTLDLGKVLDLILDSLWNLVPFDRGSVMLRRDEILEIVAARGFPAEVNPLQIRVSLKDDDVFDQLKRSKTYLLVSDVLARPDWHQVENLPQARSWMGVSLINPDEKVMGMVSLTRETPLPFTNDDAALVTAFAGQAAIALQNASLYSELSQAYEQLERLDRTKSDFISVASHELRTPLTLLQGFSQILLKDPAIKDDASRYQMMEGISRGAVRLHEIVNSMLDMAKIDSQALQLHIAKIGLADFMRVVVDEFRAALQERELTLDFDVPADLPQLEADIDSLRKVFYHLVVNAIKYTPDGGSISITARELSAEACVLKVPGVEVVVSDSGIGIDPHFQDLIFSKFYQTGTVALHSSGKTKFKAGGPGLGLAIAKGIVESHNGRIWVKSPGYDEETCPGSQFYIVLPLHQTSAQPPLAAL